MSMKLYTVMAMDTSHIDQICEDVKNQYENGVANCALFMIKLVPEGNPVIDKASIEAEKYVLFRDRLEEMGMVGPADGNKPRKILVTKEELAERMMNEE